MGHTAFLTPLSAGRFQDSPHQLTVPDAYSEVTVNHTEGFGEQPFDELDEELDIELFEELDGLALIDPAELELDVQAEHVP